MYLSVVVFTSGLFNATQAADMQDMLGITAWSFSTQVTSNTTMNYQNIDQVNQSQTASACQRLQ